MCTMDDVRDYWTGVGLLLIKRLEKKYPEIFKVVESE